MATITVRSKDAGKAFSYIANGDLGRIENEVVRRAKGGALDIQNEVLSVLSGQGSGRWYGRHQASAPGEPPAVWSGALRNSFSGKGQTDVIKNMNETIVLSKAVSNLATKGVSPGYNYAWIDQGTSRMAPRPYVRETAERAHEVLKKDLGRPYYV